MVEPTKRPSQPDAAPVHWQFSAVVSEVRTDPASKMAQASQKNWDCILDAVHLQDALVCQSRDVGRDRAQALDLDTTCVTRQDRSYTCRRASHDQIARLKAHEFRQI